MHHKIHKSNTIVYVSSSFQTVIDQGETTAAMCKPISSKIDGLLDARQSLADYCQSDDLSEDGLRKRIDQFAHIDNTRALSASTGRIILHHACMNERVTVGIVTSILDSFPAAAEVDDEEEFQPIPLHVACWNRSTTVDIVRLLIDAFPDSVHRQSVDGGMPLHYLCCGDCNDTDALNILELLLEKYPHALKHTTDAGMLPMHLAACASKSPEFCQMLIDAYAYPSFDTDDDDDDIDRDAYPSSSIDDDIDDDDDIDRDSTEYLESIFHLIREHPEILKPCHFSSE